MDRYRKIRVVGKGAFGAAVLVQSRARPSDQYIIKEVDVSRLGQRERDEAKKEIKLLASFDHPNIVRYRDSFLEMGKLHIVMDFAEGGDLHNLLKQTAASGQLLPEDLVLDYFVQLCLAMKHVHDRKVLHRDIKSQNIFLTQNKKVVKLGDFGIARMLNSTVELARTACGTPYYMSPEICDNKPYNDKSDVWSMGCLLYEMASLKCPFDARDMRGLVVKILRGAFPPLPRVYSADLSQLVGRCLMRDPSKRPSVNELLELPVVRRRIERFLTEQEAAAEFAHTMIHRNPSRNKEHPAMNDLVKRDIAKRAPPPVPATPAAPVVAAPPPPYTPPVRSSSGTPTPSVFKGAGGGGIARPAYGLREQYEAQQAARARSLEEERKAAVQAERRRLLEAQQQRVAEQRAAQELAAQGRAVAAREAAAARARAAAAEQLHNPTGAIGLGARNVQVNPPVMLRVQTPPNPELARLQRQRQLLEERRRELQRAREAEEEEQAAARRRAERAAAADGYARRVDGDAGIRRNNPSGAAAFGGAAALGGAAGYGGSRRPGAPIFDAPTASAAREEYLSRQRQAEANRRRQLDDLGLGAPGPSEQVAGGGGAAPQDPMMDPMYKQTKEWGVAPARAYGFAPMGGGGGTAGGAGGGGGGFGGGGGGFAGGGGNVGGAEGAPSVFPVDHRAQVLADAAQRRRAEMEAKDAAAREACRRVYLENQAAAHANRAKLAGNDPEAIAAAEAARAAAAEAIDEAEAVRAAATAARPAAAMPPSDDPSRPVQQVDISAAARRAEFHAAKEAAERNRQRVHEEQVQLRDGSAVDGGAEAEAAVGRPLRVPEHIARRMDQRQAEAAERRLRRGGSRVEPGREGAHAGEFGGAGDEYGGNYEPAGEIDQDEVRRVEAQREEEQFGAMLETLRELQMTKPGDPDAGSGEEALGATERARAAPAEGDDAEEEEQLRLSAADQDLVAAGLMSGMEEETEDEVAGSTETSAAALRRKLTAQLGERVFTQAHARLQCVAEEEDDDVLVGDIQRILGAERLDKLPMMLKLIFLEEQQQAA